MIAIGGGAVLLADPYKRWITATLERSLAGYTLEPNGLSLFIAAYYARRQDNTRLRMFAAAEVLIDAKWALSQGMAEDTEEEEREILSDFLIGSDFFDNYPKGSKTITYRGPAEACGSPFATF